jgi:hypothetical protein
MLIRRRSYRSKCSRPQISAAPDEPNDLEAAPAIQPLVELVCGSLLRDNVQIDSRSQARPLSRQTTERIDTQKKPFGGKEYPRLD